MFLNPGGGGGGGGGGIPYRSELSDSESGFTSVTLIRLYQVLDPELGLMWIRAWILSQA